MKKNYFYTACVSCAIALNAAPIQAQETQSQDSAEIVFVCAIQKNTPTMFAYTPGEVNLTPLMSWHQEYLLPEQSGQEVCLETANKLQDSVQQEQAKYLKSQTPKEGNSVCLVAEEDLSCATENSETLFVVNPNYNASCVLENKNPIECKALQVRGIYSFDDKPYQPLWWPW
ncbi:hypothetical protein IQ255_23680 [Pleurocapsales cyanobacterium LEGE 10410]|nr:hypothetical protein [Pleurocapsales cyanobacterium LEGE 10410]